MAEMTGSTLEIVAGNLLDADSMAAAVAGCDWVLRTGGWEGGVLLWLLFYFYFFGLCGMAIAYCGAVQPA